MLQDEAGLMQFYTEASGYCIENFKDEIEWARKIKFEDTTAERFFTEYVWTVLCSGFKTSIAQKIMKKAFVNGFHPELIGNQRKRKAVEQGFGEFPIWFDKLKTLPEDKRIDYLDSLPYIGPITRYHFARNIGLDYSKPDVHLKRLAERFGFEDVHKMCGLIAAKTNERIGVVDLILWRYSERGQPQREALVQENHEAL